MKYDEKLINLTRYCFDVYSCMYKYNIFNVN